MIRTSLLVGALASAVALAQGGPDDQGYAPPDNGYASNPNDGYAQQPSSSDSQPPPSQPNDGYAQQRGYRSRASYEPPCGGYFSRWGVGQPPSPIAGGIDYSGPIYAPNHGSERIVPRIGGGGGGDGLKDPVVFLVAAVVVTAALPVVIYALDSEATVDVSHCWMAPSSRFTFFGGTGSDASFGSFGTQVDATYGYLGFSGSVERGAPSQYNADAHLLLRIHPRQHVELSLGFGVRQLYTRSGEASYFELSLPHRYYPFRRDAWEPGVSLFVRPAFSFAGPYFDVRLDGALELPLGRFWGLQLGGRAYSAFGQVRFAALAGFSFAP